MVSETTPPRRPILTLDDLARPLTRRPERLHALTAAELAIAFSQGLDLAEGKAPGHAQRVCYVAASLADAMSLEPAKRGAVFYAALLHDIGVAPAASDVCRVAGIDEEAIFGPSPLRGAQEGRRDPFSTETDVVSEALAGHVVKGAEVAERLELGEGVGGAVASHHEQWDGGGFPEGIAAEEIAIEARIVAVADIAESLIGQEISSLVARRHFAESIAPYAGVQLDPRIVGLALDLSRTDEFWLGLYAEDLAGTLLAMKRQEPVPGEARKSRKRVMRFAEVFAVLSDAKGHHTGGHSRVTADGAARLAEAVGLDEGHVEMIRIAALLHDLGLLGVPARIMAKPDILSVTEMQLMRQHPANSEMILQDLPGFEEVAIWIARHHERPDGKGYPEMLAGDDIPLEARILAVADVYAALTSERPHRGAMQDRDAKQVLLGAAGTQLDPELVRTFVGLL